MGTNLCFGSSKRQHALVSEAMEDECLITDAQVLYEKISGKKVYRGEMEMSEFSKYAIVAEQEVHSGRENQIMSVYNMEWEIKTTSRGITSVWLRKLPPAMETCHAVLFISNRNSSSVTNSARVNLGQDFKAGNHVSFSAYIHTMVVRVLKDKRKILDEFASQCAGDVIFVVNGEECKADRKKLADVSNPLNAMFYGNFAEAQQHKIELKGIESAEVFTDFLLAVSLLVQPNPTNVIAMLKLADRYDVPFLMRSCEYHLMRCYELPIVDRLLLAGRYNLDDLKSRITKEMSYHDWHKMLAEERDKLRLLESDFLLDVFTDGVKEMDKKIQEMDTKMNQARQILKKQLPNST